MTDDLSMESEYGLSKTEQNIIIRARLDKMLNKIKISDLFQIRKDQPKKQEHPVRQAPQIFDESYFDCKIVSSGLNTELIKVQAKIKDSGVHLDQLNCKWYIKNSHDFKQIEGVNSSFYQPCFDDIGSIVCAQIEPVIQGKKYVGITLMKESVVIRTDPDLDKRLKKFLDNGNQVFSGRIETFLSQNEKYNSMETPLQVKLSISLSTQTITLKSYEGEVIDTYKITEEFPQIDFIRKSFNSILFNFNQNQSMKLSFHNNYNRDLFVYIVRIISSILQKEEEPESQGKIQQKEESSTEKGLSSLSLAQNDQSLNPESPKIDSVETGTQDTKEISIKAQDQSVATNNTHLILKIDDLQKQLKNMRRKADDLNSNYNIERNYKTKLQNQIEDLRKQYQKFKKEHSVCGQVKNKLKNSLDDIRFYRNQISILKIELKQQQKKRLDLQKQLQDEKTRNKQVQMKKTIDILNQTIFELREEFIRNDNDKSAYQSEIDRLKQRQECLENENSMLRKKLESIISEKHIPNNATTHQSSINKQQQEKITTLELKIQNLEMLLKYKSGQSSPSFSQVSQSEKIGLQQIINKLTENITEKQIQMEGIKKVNKNLLDQINQLKKQGK